MAAMHLPMLHAQTAVPPAAGTGTEAAPYQIETLENLFWIAANPGQWGAHYIQAANIEAWDTWQWFPTGDENYLGWTPIGNWDQPFSGVYDGGDFKIEGLYLNRPDDETGGLFGATEGAVIKNLGIDGAEITSLSSAGIMAGAAVESELTNCFVVGTVTGSGNSIGGFVGQTNNAVLTNIRSEVTVSGSAYTGGLIGYASHSTITGCFSLSVVNGVSNSGGLVGVLNRGELTNSYSYGSVTGPNTAGGFAGLNQGGTIINCYSAAEIYGSARGFLGNNTLDGEVIASFWDIDLAGAVSSAAGTALATDEMTLLSTYLNSGWDFQYAAVSGDDDIWGIDESRAMNGGYPFLSWQALTNVILNPTPFTLSVTVSGKNSITASAVMVDPGSMPVTEYGFVWNTTGGAVYGEDSAHNLGEWDYESEFTASVTTLEPMTTYYLRSFAVSTHGVRYGADIAFKTWPADPVAPEGDGSSETPYEIASFDNLLWLSITDGVWNKYFVQTADIDASGSTYLDNGRGWRPIGNSSLHFTGSYDGGRHTIDGLFIGADSDVVESGLFGYISDAQIKNLGVTNALSESGVPAGLLVGRADNSTITESYTTGSLNLDSGFSGGLVGKTEGTEIYGSFSTADVISGTRCGGLVGFATTGTVISNSYALGSARGVQYVGGLIGWASSTSVVNSYSAGEVVATAQFNSYGGGLIGRNIETTVTESFWDTGTSGYSTSNGGTGKTTGQMKSFATFLNAGWDFEGESINGDDNIWAIYEASAVSNLGYPFHNYMDLPRRILPYTVTGVADFVKSTSVYMRGEMVFPGVPAATGHGFVWNSTGGSVVGSDDYTDLGPSATTGQFTALIENLEADTEYYIRSWGVSDDGVYLYGEELLFRTHPFDPVPPTGSGLPDDPYLIESLGNLYWMSISDSAWSSHFLQVADIDASQSSQWQDGVGWVPPGTGQKPFTGSYEGAGHTISGLYIYIDEEMVDGDDLNAGLFGHLQGAVVKGVVIEDITIDGGFYSGGVAGLAVESTISSSSVTGTISPWNSGGGIAGRITGSLIEKCYASVDISIPWGTGSGGIAGVSVNSSVTNSYAAGLVSANSRAGGVVGMQESGSQIINCYSKAVVTASASGEGGVLGFTTPDSYVKNSFWDIEVSGTDVSAGDDGVTGLTTNEMGRVLNYIAAGWDFMGETLNGTDDIWGIDSGGGDNDGYPFLAWQGYENHIAYPIVLTEPATSVGVISATLHGAVERGTIGDITDHGFIIILDSDTTVISEGPLATGSLFESVAADLSGGREYRAAAWVLSEGDTTYGNNITFMTRPIELPETPAGEGTPDNPYLISSLAELYWLSVTDTIWDRHFLQTEPIDAGETASWYEMAGWQPIGTIENPFTGGYNGDGHHIGSLTINRPGLEGVGLFGAIATEAHIKGVRLIDVDITGGSRTGGVTGDASSQSVIENCYVKGTVKGGQNSVGGIAGTIDMCTIINSYSDGMVEGDVGVGGLAGSVNSSTVTGSYSLASVTGNDITGGFIGAITMSEVANCYARGSVTGGSNSGGFAGTTLWLTEPITNSYSTGKVTGSGDNVSGFANVQFIGEATSSYWDRELSEITVSHIGESRTSEEMQYPPASNTYVGWDFETVWLFIDGLNDGYPLLAATLSLPEVTTSEVSQVTAVAAVAGGEVLSDGGKEVTARGVVWGIEEEPTLTNHTGFTVDGTGEGSFVSELTDLTPSTAYYLRAYATNAHGTTYGELHTFTTATATLTLNGSFSVFNKVYDGTRATTVQMLDISLQGVIEGYEGVSISGLTIEFEDSDASAESKTVNITAASIMGADAPLYTLSLEAAPQAEAMIMHRQLTIGGSFTVFDKDYDGTTAAVIDDNSLTLSGAIAGDDVYLANLVVGFSEAGPGDDITVVITDAALAGDQSHNYTFTLESSPVTTASIAAPTATGRLAAGEVVLYPNPFAERIYISNAEHAVRVVITCMRGKRHIDTNIDGDGYIETASLSAGVYFVQVLFRDGTGRTVIMIKGDAPDLSTDALPAPVDICNHNSHNIKLWHSYVYLVSKCFSS